MTEEGSHIHKVFDFRKRVGFVVSFHSWLQKVSVKPDKSQKVGYVKLVVEIEIKTWPPFVDIKTFSITIDLMCFKVVDQGSKTLKVVWA